MVIDFRAIISGGLWILGLALILATLSWANYEAKSSHIRLREALTRPTFQRFMDFGLALFCLGLALGASRWWERALWFAFSAIWLGWLLWDFWQNREGGRQR